MLETVLASCIFLLTAPTPAASSEIAAVSEPAQVQTCSCRAETLIVKGDRTRKGKEIINPEPEPYNQIPPPPQGTTPNPIPLDQNPNEYDQKGSSPKPPLAKDQWWNTIIPPTESENTTSSNTSSSQMPHNQIPPPPQGTTPNLIPLDQNPNEYDPNGLLPPSSTPQGTTPTWNPQPVPVPVNPQIKPVNPQIKPVNPQIKPVNPTSSNNKPFPGPGPDGEENVGSCTRCGRDHNNRP